MLALSMAALLGQTAFAASSVRVGGSSRQKKLPTKKQEKLAAAAIVAQDRLVTAQEQLATAQEQLADANRKVQTATTPAAEAKAAVELRKAQMVADSASTLVDKAQTAVVKLASEPGVFQKSMPAQELVIKEQLVEPARKVQTATTLAAEDNVVAEPRKVQMVADSASAVVDKAQPVVVKLATEPGVSQKSTSAQESVKMEQRQASTSVPVVQRPALTSVPAVQTPAPRFGASDTRTGTSTNVSARTNIVQDSSVKVSGSATVMARDSVVDKIIPGSMQDTTSVTITEPVTDTTSGLIIPHVGDVGMQTTTSLPVLE